jgi:REP-associated tyrosine transposase
MFGGFSDIFGVQYARSRARGIGQRPIFESSSDFLRYEALMRKHLTALYPDVRLLCYCLMTNHVHQFLFGQVDALSHYMKSLQQEYVQFFNRIRDRSGPLHKSRFWSRPCQSHEDLMKTIHYIDQNPVVAGLTAAGGLYAWGV